jgi:hypothetical protein
MGLKPRFRMRTFVSLLTATNAAALLVSGVGVYIKPEGSVARALDWTFLALSKGQWESVHTTLGVGFMLVSGMHLWLNWSAFVNHLRRTRNSGPGAMREGLLALLVVALVVALTLASVPPFGTIVEFGDRIKEGWKSQVEGS